MQDLQSPLRSPTDIFGDPTDPNPPQWLNPNLFQSPNFDPENYISDLRTFVPLETLRTELQSHFTSLQRDLIDLINRDYVDFVSLSTKLIDVDSSIVRMRAPLLELREKIEHLRNAVEKSLSDLQNRLQQRANAGEAREVLELLLDTFHVASKVEKLIKELPRDNDTNNDNVRETQSMLLERIASEMNRLKFYIRNAKDMPFIENMEKRITNASLLLDTSLRCCLVDGLEYRDENAIYNCLRAYAAIDNTKNAEETFRSTVVGPLIEKVIPEKGSGGGVVGGELEEDYVKIKKYIEDDCKFLLNISSIENSGLHVSSFLANSILKEVHSAIQKGKPVVFSPGRPTVFLKNYKASLDFLAHLEGYCPSRSEVVKFRSEAAYIDFMKQWNVGVYFSLRFQEIAGALDSALSVAGLAPVGSDQRKPQDLILKQSTSLLECLRSCWRDDVLVLSCSDKFLRLSLQLMARFSNWLSAGLAAREAGNAGSNPGFEWAISASSDDLVYVVHDLNRLVEEICGDYLEQILELLKSCPVEVCDFVKQSILQGGKSLKGLLPIVMSAIIETIVEKSVEDLRQLKGITATYRMTNKPLPVRHSPYVTGVLRPLKEFLDGERAATCLTNEIRNELLQSAALEITRRYNDLASELVNMSRRTESSLQKLRLGAQRRAGASSDVSDHNLSDTDKICMQLFLDIQEYARSLSLLGVDAASIPPYQSLWQCVAPAERQNTISF
ncbi:conserved oligomeric Golgi complex subunit 2-like [Lycium barbarum]|uniref:conserved oligomeric Golgi complex subunit 2-like n=1 Tax=Lycium barbarum TaxID=112863 RepID=UPI00293F2F6C|nr:conserved oligomeric Golgi complex subunit 2-like [Lycium barbarum]